MSGRCNKYSSNTQESGGQQAALKSAPQFHTRLKTHVTTPRSSLKHSSATYTPHESASSREPCKMRSRLGWCHACLGLGTCGVCATLRRLELLSIKPVSDDSLHTAPSTQRIAHYCY